MTRTELKTLSKDQIRGNIGTLFAISVVIILVEIAASIFSSIIPIAGTLIESIFVSAPLTFSSYIIYLNLTKGTLPSVGDAFSGYRDFWGAFKVSFFTGLFTLLWSLLLFVPGIIKAISYSLAYYILAENEGMGALEAITRSKEMMNGHKMDYFVLSLSFIGWMFLVAITFGIAGIWVFPYMSTTFANFYNSIKSQQAYTYQEF